MLSRTLLVWLVGLPVTMVLFIAVLLLYAAGGGWPAVHRVGALWCRVILALAGVRVTVKGAEKIPKDRPVVFASNHQGAFDIPALQGYLPTRFRWVAKRSLFKIPVIGWSMSMAGYIGIERENAQDAYQGIEDASGKITEGSSVLIFPEGTRSRTGELLPFKRGGFLLAVKSGAPVVPLAVAGTRDIMKRGGVMIRPHPVVISVGGPIRSEGVSDAELRRRARIEIDGLLRGARG
jgi:1-acyl-sn-glycerol-3-phosphate acyltransferase